MKKNIFLTLIVLPFFALAQNSGIRFQHDPAWKEVLTEAKAKNKFIFMDCFTTWCGPCKYMSATVFPLEKVGSYMNNKFLSVAVQLDTTKNDNESVKAWYKDAHDIAQRYNVTVYPTYLIFDADGNIVHRFVGSTSADEFLANIEKSINPNSQFYTLQNEYKNGNREAAFLHDLAIASLDAYDLETATRISNEYLATQRDLYTKENLEFLKKFTYSSDAKGFDIIRNEPGKVDAALGKGSAASIITPIILREEIFLNLPEDPKTTPDWEKLKAGVAKKYPAFADEAIAKAKVAWYQSTRDWDHYQTAIVDYMNTYGSTVSPEELNNYAWTVFQNCADMKCVGQALEWSKRSLGNNDNPMFIDTYANILYRMGRKDEAMNWEQKALDMAPEADKKGYGETLNKMKNNEKTWN